MPMALCPGSVPLNYLKDQFLIVRRLVFFSVLRGLTLNNQVMLLAAG